MIHEVLMHRLLDNPSGWGVLLAIALVWLVATIVPRSRNRIQAELELAKFLLELHDTTPAARNLKLNPQLPLMAAQILFRLSYGWQGWIQIIIGAFVLVGGVLLIVLTTMIFLHGITGGRLGLALVLVIALGFTGWGVVQVREGHQLLGLRQGDEGNVLNTTLEAGVVILRGVMEDSHDSDDK